MKHRYFFIITLFLYVIAVSAANDGFPWSGGTTSDGIKISKVEMDGFEVMKKSNSLKVANDCDNAFLEFTVNVPQGQTACLRYKLLLKMFPSKSGKNGLGNSKITYIARVGKKQRYYYENSSEIFRQSDVINIPEGTHTVSIDAIFKGSNFITAGSLDSVSIHLHKYSKVNLSREPLCGVPGEGYSRCDICRKDSLVKVAPLYDKHSMIVTALGKSSCLSTADSVSACEHCPYFEILHGGKRKDHDFGTDGTCKVCGLHMPQCNAEKTVYEINNAGEMRVLSEMVSLGRIPGNIGIDIKSDLEFSKDVIMLPLGTFDFPFQGVLNGNGHRIRGITNAFQGIDCLGFVGVAKGTLLSHAVIANLIFDSGNHMRGKACVGGIVGYAQDCDILNCASFGSLEGTDYVAGIVGYAGQQVTIHNCAAVSAIRTKGKWNTMVCGMPMGHILNSYGAGTNERGGTLDSLMTTTLRHCFSTQGSCEGLTQVREDILSSYDMVQLLNEESETPCFMMTEEDHYPIPVANSTVAAKPNAAVRTKYNDTWTRAASSASDDDDDDSEKENEVEVQSGYVDEFTPSAFSHTPEEIIADDAIQYADLERYYIVTRTAPKGFEAYDRISGGDMLGFESCILPSDSSYMKMIEYDVVSSDKVLAKAETMYYYNDGIEQIDQYEMNNGVRSSLKARLTFENEFDIHYKESVDGILKPVWSIETTYDAQGNATVTNAWSFDHRTGESHLEYSCKYDDEEEEDEPEEDDVYDEYYDAETNTIHILYNYPVSVTGGKWIRDHYILRASDEYLMEMRMETIVSNKAYLIDGMYLVYNDNNELEQAVAFGPEDTNSLTSDIHPYLYHEYFGFWKTNPFPTAIKVPTMDKPSLQKQMDVNVYDMHGRVVRRVTDMRDPFSGLPQGVYVYQGAKYLVRNNH